MTTEQSTLLALIRSSLWGEQKPNNADEAFVQAQIQALVPLLYPESPAARIYSAHYIRILFAQDEIVSLMSSADIPMAVLKGSAAAVYYPDPFLRTMGDIDFIVPAERFQEAVQLMQEHGYSMLNNTGEKDEQNRHFTLRKDGITAELHHHFSSDGIDIERYVEAGLSCPESAVVEGHAFLMLPPLENGIVLLAHVAQHLKKDLGMRQVLDWMMYVDKVLTDDLWEHSFQKAANSCGLELLAVTMTRMCQLYLGLPTAITWCKEADPELAEDLLNNILQTGNFGHQYGSGSRVERVSTEIQRFGLFPYLQIAGEYNWKTYHKHHWLKPFCWLYQVFRYAKQGVKAGRNGSQLSSDLSRAGSRYDLLTRLGID